MTFVLRSSIVFVALRKKRMRPSQDATPRTRTRADRVYSSCLVPRASLTPRGSHGASLASIPLASSSSSSSSSRRTDVRRSSPAASPTRAARRGVRPSAASSTPSHPIFGRVLVSLALSTSEGETRRTRSRAPARGLVPVRPVHPHHPALPRSLADGRRPPPTAHAAEDAANVTSRARSPARTDLAPRLRVSALKKRDSRRRRRSRRRSIKQTWATSAAASRSARRRSRW